MKYRIIYKLLSILHIKFLEVVYLSPSNITPPPGFDTVVLSAEQLRQHVRSGLIDYKEEDIARIEQGVAICVAATKQERLAGICWYAIKPYPHTQGYLAKIHPDFICGYGLHISREYRGQGVHAVLVQEALKWMSAHNKRGLLLAVNFDNHSSRRSAEKMGFARLGWSFYHSKIGVLKKVKHYYSIVTAQ